MKRSGINRARTLRRGGTDAEKLLWSHLRNRQIEGVKFRRQVPVGRYIADFLCVEAMLIVEADGGQHSEEADAVRTAALEAAGYKVIRFWNNEILGNTGGVLEGIRRELLRRTPHPPTA
ncbi:DUF559 domain-containing protein [Pyruvatibacter mobilis]|uniref:DUF559 domain-containing protein n=1 Tax=Pyruvatibacter mobilis TaxID=1712261 RepID=A0A845QEH4_9HYPH|nr:endonuclease domain-containing protein [Pyruvatibacter mobilis]NBG96983.1 DUF559 domain-containing protein [Pyruvatibacter mobilis]QJD74462.1 endonuclease domain-containing protein [Pyruvatibacter mobilis]GGD07134.1 hypothetical protein GCM10011587_08900 [Pyruvatibacter mobilis]